MNFKCYLLALVLTFIPITVKAQIASGGSFSLEKSVVASGGESAGGDFALTGTIGQHTAGTNSNNLEFVHSSGFWTPEQFAPTAAMVTIGGKVRTSDGRGIKNVQIILTDESGASRIAVSGTLGFYRFTDVEVGQIYILTIVSKRFTFPISTQVLAVKENVQNIDFTAN